jgi:hypothetical protein
MRLARKRNRITNMSLATLSRAVTDNRTEKEAKLKSFIADGINATTLAGVTLVAKSCDSPVALALNAALSGSAGDDIGVRAIVMEWGIDEVAIASLMDRANSEVRVLRDPRFGAAHEQLVISTDRVWMGDCMRRDPSKRDAFEIYHSGNRASRDHAAASFEKLWASATPLKRIDSVNAALLVAGQSAGEAQPRASRS